MTKRKGERKLEPSKRRKCRQVATPKGVELIKELNQFVQECGQALPIPMTSLKALTITRKKLRPGASKEQASRTRRYHVKYGDVPVGSFFSLDSAKQGYDVAALRAGGEAVFFIDKRHPALKIALVGISELMMRTVLKSATVGMWGPVDAEDEDVEESDDTASEDDEFEGEMEGELLEDDDEDDEDGDADEAEEPPELADDEDGEAADVAGGGADVADDALGVGQEVGKDEVVAWELQAVNGEFLLPLGSYDKPIFLESEDEDNGFKYFPDSTFGTEDDTVEKNPFGKTPVQEGDDSLTQVRALKTKPLTFAKQSSGQKSSGWGKRSSSSGDKRSGEEKFGKAGCSRSERAKQRGLNFDQAELLSCKNAEILDLKEQVSDLKNQRAVSAVVDQGRIQTINAQTNTIADLHEERADLLKALKERHSPLNTFLGNNDGYDGDDNGDYRDVRIPQL